MLNSIRETPLKYTVYLTRCCLLKKTLAFRQMDSQTDKNYHNKNIYIHTFGNEYIYFTAFQSK